MLQNKSYLTSHFCEVQIRSLKGYISELAYFQKIYSTPSKISYKVTDKKRDFGLEYTNKVSLFYPGINRSFFQENHQFLLEEFIVRLITSNGDIYQVGHEKIPLKISFSFTSNRGTKITLSNKTVFPTQYVGKIQQIKNELPVTLKVLI